ncbi:MAG: hypothetical protein HY516_02365 [Candidatus Aenigmarchaeota archaeon]|nr:hypothetical protein [Candidatus Aenigmarchaeota archaeon]
MATIFRSLSKTVEAALDYPLLGSMPSHKQEAVRNGFNPVVGSLTSAAAEFFISFSLLFMLMNGVFTSYVMLSQSWFSLLTKALLSAAAAEGLYRTFLIISGRTRSVGSVFYDALELVSAGVSKFFAAFVIGLAIKQTPEEKKQKEIAENFKKFIEYGMDNPGLTWEKQ